MFEAQQTNDGKLLPQASGWVIGELNGVRYFGKQGGGLGFHGNMRLYPEAGIGTVLLAKSMELSASPIDSQSDELDGSFVFWHRRKKNHIRRD
jgi:hypothetical protein